MQLHRPFGGEMVQETEEPWDPNSAPEIPGSFVRKDIAVCFHCFTPLGKKKKVIEISPFQKAGSAWWGFWFLYAQSWKGLVAFLQMVKSLG